MPKPKKLSTPLGNVKQPGATIVKKPKPGKRTLTPMQKAPK